MKNVLVLCTGNSCRSILGEALLNQLGGNRFRAFSAGSFPTGKVNPNALAALRRHGLSAEGFASKSWESLADTPIDILITVCDEAGGETCPAYLGKAVRGHWGLPDPAKATGTPQEIENAFEKTYAALERRIERLLALPLESLSDDELANALDEIGRLPA
ncbi:MAG: arsenate reductase ArsC [Pseudomonadota bacterium]